MQRDMEYIYKVYKTGSFSKAAKLLYASQPTVSMAVQRVEEELGHALFNRDTHPLQLTEVGKLYIAHAERSFQSEQQFHAELTELLQPKDTQLRLGCIHLLFLHLLPDLLSECINGIGENPPRILSATPSELNQKLLGQEIDLAITTIAQDRHKDLQYLPAFSVQFLVAVPQDFPINKKLVDFALSYEDIQTRRHLSKHCPRVPLSLFANTPFVALTEDSDFYPHMRKLFNEAEFSPQTVCHVSTPLLAASLAGHGVAATLIGSLLLEPDFPLVYYRLRSHMDEQQYFFAMRRDHVITPGQRLFMQRFQDRVNR